MRIDPYKKLHPCFSLGYNQKTPVITPMEILLLTFMWYMFAFVVIFIVVIYVNKSFM